MRSQGGIDVRQKVVWEKRGRGRWVNLSLHSRACVLLAACVLSHVRMGLGTRTGEGGLLPA